MQNLQHLQYLFILIDKHCNSETPVRITYRHTGIWQAYMHRAHIQKPMNQSSNLDSTFLAVLINSQRSFSSSLAGNKSVPKSAATLKNWSNDTFSANNNIAMLIPVGWYWMILTVGSISVFLKVISDQSKDIDTHPTHITHTLTSVLGRLECRQWTQEWIQCVLTAPLSVGDSSPSVYIKQGHSCAYTLTCWGQYILNNGLV